MIAKHPTLTPAEREAWSERAGILEFDAGLPRAEAERRAFAIVLAKRCDESRTSGRR